MQRSAKIASMATGGGGGRWSLIEYENGGMVMINSKCVGSADLEPTNNEVR